MVLRGAVVVLTILMIFKGDIGESVFSECCKKKGGGEGGGYPHKRENPLNK